MSDNGTRMNPEDFPEIDRPQWTKPKINSLTGNHGEPILLHKSSHNMLGGRRAHYAPSEGLGPALDIPELFIKPNNRLDSLQEISMCDVDYDGDKEIVTPSKPIRQHKQRPRHDHSERARRLRKTGRQPASEPEAEPIPEPDFWKYLVKDNTLNCNGSPLPGINEVPVYVASPSPTDFGYKAPTVASRPTTRISSPYTDLFGRRAGSRRAVSPVSITSSEDDTLWQDVVKAYTNTKEPPSSSTTCDEVLDILLNREPEPTTVCLPRDVASTSRPPAAYYPERRATGATDATTAAVKAPRPPTASRRHPKRKSKKHVVPSPPPQIFPQPTGYSAERFIKLPPSVKKMEKEVREPKKAALPDMPEITGYMKPLGSAISALPPIRDGTPVINQQMDAIGKSALLPHPPSPRTPKAPASKAIGQKFAGNVRRGRYKVATANKFQQ